MGWDWSFCGVGIACGIGSGITGFTGFTASFTGIQSTFCA
jgi:hypothetical protein